MTARTWLRLAAIVSLLQGGAHAVSAAPRPPAHGAADVAAGAGLLSSAFQLGHTLHTYGQMYTGYQIFVVVACLVQAALVWDLGPLAAVAPRPLRPALLVLVCGNVLYAVLTFHYLVPQAAIFDLLVGILLLAAWAAAHRPVTRA